MLGPKMGVDQPRNGSGHHMGNNLIRPGIKRKVRMLPVSLVRSLRPPSVPLHEVLEELGVGGRTAVLVGLASLADYFGWLGWDHTLGQPWQFVGLALGLAMIAAVAGGHRRPWEAAVVTATVMTVCDAGKGAMDPHSDGLFILGALMFGLGTFLGAGFVALVSDGLARGKSPGQALPRAIGLSPGWRSRPFAWLGLVALYMALALVQDWLNWHLATFMIAVGVLIGVSLVAGYGAAFVHRLARTESANQRGSGQ
jgi:hypothetical protein